MEQVLEARRKIASLEIQGATNVALYAIESLVEYTKQLTETDSQVLLDKVEEAKTLLFDARPTEPAMRNGLNFITRKLANYIQECGDICLVDIPSTVEAYGQEYVKILNDSRQFISKFGSRRIPDSSVNPFTVMTHCHSSNVTDILIEAHNMGKQFDVICTETRPVHQGRITATKLANAGIKVRYIVDSAMRWAVYNCEVDLIIIGADAITSEGTVLNKIGSRLLALVAHERHVPFYVATSLLKYNPDTVFGVLEKIEMRDPREIWESEPDFQENIEVLNPAFETVARRYIDGLITEVGIFPSGSVHLHFRDKYPLLV